MKYISLVVLMLLISINAQSQTEERCGSTIQAHTLRMEKDAEYKRHVEEWRKKISPIVRERRSQKNPSCSNGPILVPIAIHFDNGIVPATQEACVITVVEDQIAELNLEILGLDSDASLINNFTSCFGANILGDACLEFCIATANHPSGYGLVDGDLAITFGQLNFNVPGGNYTPVNPDWNEYVNVYVDNLPGGLLGVSNGIPGQFNGDGVLVDNCVFGTGNISCPGVQLTGSSGCFGLYDEGETLAHEIGHYFGLYHIWGDNSNCNGAQDQIPDTPDMSSNYSGYSSCANHNSCSDLPQTCGDEDMYMNFMSYASDGCMYMFTSDQADVMNATAVAEGFTNSSAKCSDPVPVADFEPSGNIDLCNDLSIAYTDLSMNMPTSWTWTFNVISGNITLDINNSSMQNPIVNITGGTSGTIETELIVSNTAGSDDIIKNQIVSISPPTTWYADNDGDFFGNPNSSVTDCNQPAGYVLNSSDCDDNDPNNYPGNIEVCDGSDNNCNGLVDDDDPGLIAPFWYRDLDGDMFGDETNFIQQCTQPAGYVSDDTDCDDLDPNNFPGNDEICDNQDNDCDGLIDDSDPDVIGNTYYLDFDMDDFGDPNVSVIACDQPSGYVTDNTDCDDENSNVFPGNNEICDGIDNNCDGIVDEGCDDPFICDDDSLYITSIIQDDSHAFDYILSDGNVISGANVLFTAGIDIDLVSGFEVDFGAAFEARIETCLTLIKEDNPTQNFKYLNNIINKMPFEFDNNSGQAVRVKLYNTDLSEIHTIRSIDSKEKLTQEIISQLEGFENGVYLLEVTGTTGQKAMVKILFIQD